MIYLLDTNICVYLRKQNPLHVHERVRQYSIGDLGISSVSAAELQFGVARSDDPRRNQQALDLMLTSLIVVSFGHSSAIYYGQLRNFLERRGTPIGLFDTLIAAHALELGVTLVTNNTREFERVPGLKLENWTTPATGN